MNESTMERPTESPLGAPRIRDFFLARQPILNGEQELVAYELLFRTAAVDTADVTDDLAATAAVIAHASELGLEHVIGPSLAFINVDRAVLMSDFIHFLPRQKVVLEILETVQVTEPLLKRVKELVDIGFRFALDDVVADSENVRSLLPLIRIVKIDIAGMSRDRQARLSQRYKMAGKLLVAEKVETREQYRDCLALGFDFFQGYYFAKPTILKGKRLLPSQEAVMRLMAQFATEADTSEIEESIKQDVSLGLTLMRLVNTPLSGASHKIDSIGQALAMLGRQQLLRWLQILLYAEPDVSNGTASPLLRLATSRGKLMELLAERIRPGETAFADTAFAVGIMSPMDALFSLPMAEILGQLQVAPEVCGALLERRGTLGELLELVERMECARGMGQPVSPLLEKLQLSADELYALQVAAFEWSDALAESPLVSDGGPRRNLELH